MSVEARQAKFARLDFPACKTAEKKKKRSTQKHRCALGVLGRGRAFNFRRKGGSSGFVSVRRTRRALWEQSRRETSDETTLARHPLPSLRRFRFVPLPLPPLRRQNPSLSPPTDREERCFRFEILFPKPSVPARREVAIKRSDVSTADFTASAFSMCLASDVPLLTLDARADEKGERGFSFCYRTKAREYDVRRFRRFIVGCYRWKNNEEIMFRSQTQFPEDCRSSRLRINNWTLFSANGSKEGRRINNERCGCIYVEKNY